MTTPLEQLPFPEDLPGFGPPLMAHASAASAALLAPLTAAENVGAVLTTFTGATARAAVRRIRRVNAGASLLLDADRYSGQNRSFGHQLSPEWIAFQHRLMLPWALTDSWYVAAGDVQSLRKLFRQAAGLGPRVILALPLALSWLTSDIDILLAEIDQARLPVGLMLEAERDPISEKGTVTGLLRVISTGVPVLVLRSDVAAIGSLAFGAAAAAIGTSSGRRHIYPVQPPRAEDAPPPPSHISAVVPVLMAYKWLSVIERGTQHNPTLPLWLCECSTCLGQSIDWIIRANDPSAAAFQHSIASLAGTALTILAPPTQGGRASAWRQACAVAQVSHDQVERPSGTTWTPSDALKRWQLETQPVPASR